MHRKATASTVAALLFLATGPAAACGANMFEPGDRVRFGARAAPRPATVVLYADEVLRARNPGDPAAFERALELSGHQVVLASDGAELEAALAAQPVDVVIADIGVLGPAGAARDVAGSTAALLPVIHAEDERATATASGYPLALAHDAGLLAALRAIDQLLKLRPRP